MGKNARLLLRRIALGLPIVGAPVGGFVLLLSASACTCTGPGNCGQPYASTMHAIDGAQHARLFPTAGAIDSVACRDLCLQLDVSGPDDGGIDGGGLDGGLSQALYSGVACAVDSPSGVETLTCTYSTRCIGGRAPAGLAALRAPLAGVGGWLAQAAHLERASVPAFEELAGELALHGAPERLTRAAVRAAADERRHARVVSRLAARRGAETPAMERTSMPPRSLRAMAHDNAIEGCVREAYAALVAAHQAQHAREGDVRAVYSGIAADEARHALLSFAIHDWALGRLAPSDAARVEAQRTGALAAWHASPDPTQEEVRRALGLPGAELRGRFLTALA